MVMLSIDMIDMLYHDTFSKPSQATPSYAVGFNSTPARLRRNVERNSVRTKQPLSARNTAVASS